MTVDQLAHLDVGIEEGRHPRHVVHVLNVKQGVDDGHVRGELPVPAAADLNNPELVIKRSHNLCTPAVREAIQHLV